MKTKWKILCSNHQACHAIVKEMEDVLGFKKIKKTPNSPTSDVSAILNYENEQEIKQKTKTLFENHKGRIQRITISYK